MTCGKLCAVYLTMLDEFIAGFGADKIQGRMGKVPGHAETQGRGGFRERKR